MKALQARASKSTNQDFLAEENQRLTDLLSHVSAYQAFNKAACQAQPHPEEFLESKEALVSLGVSLGDVYEIKAFQIGCRQAAAFGDWRAFGERLLEESPQARRPWTPELARHSSEIRRLVAALPPCVPSRAVLPCSLVPADTAAEDCPWASRGFGGRAAGAGRERDGGIDETVRASEQGKTVGE